MSDDSAQKRRQQRVGVTLKVQLKYADRDAFVERFSINVSKNGLFIRARDPAPIGSRVSFEYRLQDNSRVLRGVGIVRWVRTVEQARDPEEPPGMGIEFVDLDPQSEELVTHIVATRGEGLRAPRRDGPRAAQGAAASGASVEENAPAALLEPSLGSEEIAALESLDAEPAPPKAEPAVAKEAAESSATAELMRKLRKPAEPGAGARAPAPRARSADVDAELAALLGDTVSDLGVAKSASAAAPAVTIDEEPGGGSAAEELELGGLPVDLEAPETELALEIPETPPPRAAPAPAPPAPQVAPAETPIVALDLCGSDFLGTLAMCGPDHVDRFEEHRVALHASLDGDALQLGRDGAWLPALLSWCQDAWPAPRALAAARRLGLTLAPTDDGRAGLRLGPSVVALTDILTKAARALAHAYQEASRDASSTVAVVPSSAVPPMLNLVRRTLGEAQLKSVRVVPDALAVLSSVGLNLAGGQFALVVQVTLLETRVALIGAGERLHGTRALCDASLWDADDLLCHRAGVALLREHGIDVNDDVELRQSLMTQVRELRRNHVGDAAWELSLAGGLVQLPVAALSEWTAPASERVAVVAHDLLNEHGVSADAVAGAVLVTDEMPWPGLIDTFEAMTGFSPILPDAGPWIRIDGATRLRR